MSELRALPYDEAVEEAFVAGLLYDPTQIMYVFSKVPIEALYKPSYRQVYEGIITCFTAHVEISIISVCDAMARKGTLEQAGGRAIVEKLKAGGSLSNTSAMSAIIIDHYIRRIEIEMCENVVAQSFDRSNDLSTRLTNLEKWLRDIRLASAATDDVALGFKEWTVFYANYLRSQDATKGQPRLDYVYPSLRKLLPTLEWGELIGLVGDEGAGKSSIIEQQAEYWWRQGWVGMIYHLETSPVKMANRRVARHTGIPLRSLQDNRDPSIYLTPDQLTKIIAAQREWSTWPGNLILVHCPGWTMAQITADMRVRADTLGARFALVDYWNKVRVVGDSGLQVTQMANDLELFKTTLEQLRMVGCMAGQVDKGSKNSRQTSLVNVRDGGALLADKSQTGLALIRPQEENGKRPDVCYLRVVKSNDAGEAGSVTLRMDGGRYRFIDLTVLDDEDIKYAGNLQLAYN